MKSTLITAILMCIFALSYPVAAQDTSLDGIYRQSVTISKDGMMLERGDKALSEVVIFGHGTDLETAAMNIMSRVGVICSLEDGRISEVSEDEFYISSKGMFFGDPECQVNFKKSGDNLKITGTQNCDEFCGYGAKFKGAKLKKICPADEGAIAHLTDLFYVNADNQYVCGE